jgi:hypothetical protein
MRQRAQAISELKSSARDATVTDLSEVKEQVAQLKALPGVVGPLGKKQQFAQFCELSLTALSQRQTILKDYRQMIKDIRDQSATVLVQRSQLKPQVEQLRQLTQTALGSRYYLEGDWRGEIPQAWPGQIARIE